MTGSIVFYGFGEAGIAFAGGLRPDAGRAHDIAPGPAMEGAAAGCGVSFLPDRAEALAGARLAFCLVTADQALAAAEAAAAAGIAPGMLWLDGNSCSPGTKIRAAAVIEAAGGRYVDTA